MKRIGGAGGLAVSPKSIAMTTAFLAVFALGCAHGAEGMVRERAATDFACADYALNVEEVGPDVFRAEGCGQQLIYACQRVVRKTPPSQDGEDFTDKGQEAPIVCARRGL